MAVIRDRITVVPPEGETVVVDIKSGGVSIGTAHAERTTTRTLTLPLSISERTSFYVPRGGTYSVSVKLDGVEIAGAGVPVTVSTFPTELRVRVDASETADVVTAEGGGSGGSIAEPWTFDRAEYQSTGADLNSGDKIAWQLHGVDWGFTPLDLTDPQNPTIVTGGIYAISVWAPCASAQAGKFGQLGLKLDDSYFGWHVFADAPLDGTDSPYGAGALHASATIYLPAGAVIATPVWHDIGVATGFFGQMIVQLIQPETTPDPGYEYD